MNTERDKMVTQMDAYFEKIRLAITSGGASSFRYLTGTIVANGSVVIDAPTLLEFNAADYHVYSTGIELRVLNPTIATNPPVIDAQAILTYQIAADGKITILSNYNTSVTYYARVTKPVRK